MKLIDLAVHVHACSCYIWWFYVLPQYYKNTYTIFYSCFSTIYIDLLGKNELVFKYKSSFHFISWSILINKQDKEYKQSHVAGWTSHLSLIFPHRDRSYGVPTELRLTAIFFVTSVQSQKGALYPRWENWKRDNVINNSWSIK